MDSSLRRNAGNALFSGSLICIATFPVTTKHPPESIEQNSRRRRWQLTVRGGIMQWSHRRRMTSILWHQPTIKSTWLKQTNFLWEPKWHTNYYFYTLSHSWRQSVSSWPIGIGTDGRSSCVPLLRALESPVSPLGACVRTHSSAPPTRLTLPSQTHLVSKASLGTVSSIFGTAVTLYDTLEDEGSWGDINHGARMRQDKYKHKQW